MCGIAGKLIFDGGARVERQTIAAMLAPIQHRGPDGDGIHLAGPVGLGHCRLSIIDLHTGAQPMANEDETIWIVFNGEIYNFQELREELLAKGHAFRSRSDTEVIIHLYEEYGDACVQRLRGMFAFAIWDSPKGRLFIARDRVGIKPLYYHQDPHAFRFASEIKAILTDAAVPRDINPGAIRRFFSYHYQPGEETPLRGIFKLPPGHSLVVENGKVTQHRYWDLKFTRDRAGRSFESASEELHGLIGSAVRDHMIADVPVGILLSGGLDSSAVLSFARESTSRQIKTFTVGFGGSDVVDERPYARLAAEKFGADHHDLSITAEEFWDFLPAYLWHMEELVHEPPAVALYYVSKLASTQVKVLLSGEGGDEAFAGYPNYPNMLKMDRLGRLLGPFARVAGMASSLAGTLLGDGRLQRYGCAIGHPLGEHYFSRTSSPASYFHCHARRFFSDDFLAATAAESPARFIGQLLDEVKDESLLNQMLYVDSKTWLPDDLLVKADKITMANSVELRVPLLDHGVLEFAASLPDEFKVRGSETKRLLKSTFANILPQEIVQRKKVGFPVPYAAWLRGPLRKRVEDLLLSDEARGRGYFREGQVSRLLAAHAETGRFGPQVFCLLVTELWHRAGFLRTTK